MARRRRPAHGLFYWRSKMDVGTLINAAQELAGRKDEGFNARSLSFLNEAVEHWSLALPWSTLRTEIDLVADGTARLVLPHFVRTVRWLADKSNARPIDPKEMWDREFPERKFNTSTGNASFWQEMGIEPVYRQPASAAQITARSTISDSFTVHLTGLTLDTTQSGTAGATFFTQEILSIVGSGPVTTSVFFTKLHSIGCSKTRDADLLVLNGSTQIGRIQGQEQEGIYRVVELADIPSAGTIIAAGILIQPNRLTLTTHVPHPSINPEYLKWFTVGLIHKAQNQVDMAEAAIVRANQILAQRVSQEKLGGDRDLGFIPDQQYWGSENFQAWPPL